MKDLATSLSLEAENQAIDPMNFDIRLDEAICRSRDYLLSQQTEEGYWVDKLVSNVTITAELIFFMYFTGTVDQEKQEKLDQYLKYAISFLELFFLYLLAERLILGIT